MTETEKSMEYLKEHCGGLDGYEADKAREALRNGAEPGQVERLWNTADSILEFGTAVDALAAGLGMPYAEYLARTDIGYEQSHAALRGFKKGVTLEQAEKYFKKGLEGSQVEGMCELLLSAPEETAAPFI